MFNWTPDIANDIAGAWMILFFVSFLILSVLAFGRVKWSKFVLMPVDLKHATIILIEKVVMPKNGAARGDGSSLSTVGETPAASLMNQSSTVEEGADPVDEADHESGNPSKKSRWQLDRLLVYLNTTLMGAIPRAAVNDSGAPKDKEFFRAAGQSIDADVRSFDFMCLRYIWDEQTQNFVRFKLPEDKPKDCVDRAKKGGLTESEAAAAGQLAGENAIRVEVEPFFNTLVKEFSSALYMLNFATAYVYFIFSSWNLSAVWLISLLFSGVTRVFLGLSVKKKVRDMAESTMNQSVQIYRGNKWSIYKSKDVVPGDVIKLVEGEVACCDAIVTQGNVVMNESMLTGEPMPIQKLSISPGEAKIDKKCVVYGGTEILQSMGGPDHAGGHCIAIVKEVGGSTAKGEVVRMVLYPRPMNFVFRKHLDILYALLVVWSFVIFIIVISLGDGGYWAWSVVNAISCLAYAVNPNMNMSISWAESLTVSRLQKEHISALDPSRLVVAGKVHCAVFDKTGTITEGTVNIKYVTVSSKGKFAGSEEICGDNWRQNLTVLNEAYYLYHIMGLCHMVTQLQDGRVVGNSVEVSMWTASGWSLPDEDGVASPIRTDSIQIEDEVTGEATTGNAARASREVMRKMSGTQSFVPGIKPAKILRTLRFDHARMTSGVVVEMTNKQGERQNVLLLKGSFDKLKDICNINTVPSDYQEYTDAAAGNQEYILSAAIRVLPNGFDIQGSTRDLLEADLTLVGILHFTNDLRPDSADALRELREAGIRCCMCTGDASATAIAVARKVGMLTNTDAPKSKKKDGLAGGKKKLSDSNESFNETTFADPKLKWNPSMNVIYGEVVNDVIEWSHVDTPETTYTSAEVLQMAREIPEALELILSGQCFMKIRDGPPTDNVPPLSPILPCVRITSRVTPAGKVAFVNSIASEKGVVVGMCGDGGNDCGALREAHIGLAMSSAEASLVAPFATTTESLTSFCRIVAHGRATLRTNVATTLWFTTMGIVIPVTRAIFIIVSNSFLGEWPVIYQMFGISIVVAIAICCAEPRSKLDPARPSATIFRLPFMIRLCWYVLLYGLLSAAAWTIAVNADWYEQCDFIRDVDLSSLVYTTRTQNYQSMLATLIIAIAALIFAFSVSFGGSFRRSPLWNFVLLITVGGSIVLYMIMLWSSPNGLGCVWAYNCDTPTFLNTKPVVIEQLSVTTFGDCYYGPQLCKGKTAVEANGHTYEMPTKANNCSYDTVFNQPFATSNSDKISSLMQRPEFVESFEWMTPDANMDALFHEYLNPKSTVTSLLSRPHSKSHNHLDLFNQQRQIELKNDFRTSNSSVNFTAEFKALAGKYFVKIETYNQAPLGNSTTSGNLYFDIDNTGIIMLSGFKSFKLFFLQVIASSSPNYPQAEGWWTFDLPEVAFSFYFRLEDYDFEAGDLKVGIELGGEVVGKGVGEKFNHEFFTNMPAFKDGGIFGPG